MSRGDDAMPSNDFSKAYEFSRFARRIGWLRLIRGFGALVLTGALIAGPVLLSLASSMSGVARIALGVFFAVLLAVYFWKVFPRLWSPTFSCPICGGRITFYDKLVSGHETAERAKCKDCGLYAPTGWSHDSWDHNV